MIRNHPSIYFLYIFIFLFCIGFLVVSPVYTQFSEFTFTLPNAMKYWSFYNNLLPSPSLGLRSAALSIPYDLFPSFGLGIGNSTSVLWQLGYTPFNTPFGFVSPFGTFPFLGFNIFNPFFPFSPVSLNPITSIPTSLFSPIRTAAQTGTWVGTWESTSIAFIILFHSGPMTLELDTNPSFTKFIGTGILQGSRFANSLFTAYGLLTTPIFELSGVLITSNIINLTCILTSSITMTGSYTIVGTTGSVIDQGIFNLTLV